jgi:hypothetical protein
MIVRARVLPWLLAAQCAPVAAWAEPQAPPQTVPRSATGNAPSEPAVAEAIARFKRGLELYAEGDFQAAVAEFRKAYELAPHYRVLFNIGQVCQQLQDYPCALSSFERYLAEGKDVPPERRAEVEAQIERLRLRVATLVITTNPPDAEISIDDTPIKGAGPRSTLTVRVGRRKISAVKEGYVPVTRVVEVAGAEVLSIDLALIPNPSSPQSAEPPAVVPIPTQERLPRAAPEAPPGRWTTLSWIGVGASAALAIGAGITGGLALQESSDFRNTRYTGTVAPTAADAERQKIKNLALASDVLTAGAAITLGATLILTWTRKPGAPPPRVSVGMTVSGVSVRGTF